MISILIEFHKFWAYENREVMIVDSTSTEEATTTVPSSSSV